MKELLDSIGEIVIWFFTNFIPQIANATLGAIGDLFTSIDLIKAIMLMTLGMGSIIVRILHATTKR